MTTIDIYIRTQCKTKSLVKVRYRLREKLVVLNYTSDIEIPPKIWDAKKQNIKNTKNTNIVDYINVPQWMF